MEKILDILQRDPDALLKTYKKGDLIQSPGSPMARKFYVKKGLLRSYIIDSKGKEHIFMFAPEGWIIADVESMEYDKPVELFIECLEDAEVIIFEKEIATYPNLPREVMLEYTHMLLRRMGVLQRRVMMLLSAPAQDRYAYFLKTYPELPNRVAQRMIAMYLGITPQALSTIRAKMASAKP
jgi:CRP-like cAMP-binding protein